ncbi:MAG: hypothetical protein ACK559_38565, partial [bacterium]
MPRALHLGEAHGRVPGMDPRDVSARQAVGQRLGDGLRQRCPIVGHPERKLFLVLLAARPGR